MKTKIIALFLLVLSTAIKAQYNSKNLTLASEAVSTKFTYGNMRVYPVYANTEFVNSKSGKNNLVPMKEALEKKKIIITEKQSRGSSAEVNSLYVQNVSADTVMILGGEVIEGGKQDRMIASDVIIPPHSKKIDLSVYCVEHGRWTTKSGNGNSLHFEASPTMMMASPEIRKAGGVEKNQSMVWEKVRVKTEAVGCNSSTGAYTDLQTDSAYTRKIMEYRVFFTTILKSDPKIIGAVYVTGDKILGCDLFVSHDMFMKHAANLLNSYSTEAATNGAKVTIAYNKVKEYMDNLLDEKKQEEMILKNGTKLEQNGVKYHIAYY